MFRLSSGLAPLANFPIPTPLAFPQWKRSRRIRARLVNSAIRGNDLPTTLRAHTPSRGLFLNINR
jgi:hypothetical protein